MIELLELRIIDVIEQKNMLEIVVNGFNSMIMLNTKGWREIVSFIINHLEDKQQTELIEKLLDQAVDLKKEYVSETVISEILQLSNDITLQSKSIRHKIKILISQAISNCSSIDTSEITLGYLKRIVTFPLARLDLFTKLIKKGHQLIPMNDFLLSLVNNIHNKTIFSSQNATKFAMSIAILLGNISPSIFIVKDWTLINSILNLRLLINCQETQNKIQSQIIRVALNCTHEYSEDLQRYFIGERFILLFFFKLIGMNSDAFQLLKELVFMEENEQTNLPLRFYDILMSSNNCCQKKYLFYSPTYSQRIFETCVPSFHLKLKSIKNEPSFTDLQNKCYHVLTSTLLMSPFSIIKVKKDICLPILIEALTFSSDPSGLGKAIQLLTRLINEDLDVIGKNAENLIVCLIKLLSSRIQSVSCIIEVIKCLAECIRFDSHVVKRFKNDVVNILDYYLGHSKRPVRRQAVQTVNQWHQLI